MYWFKKWFGLKAVDFLGLTGKSVDDSENGKRQEREHFLYLLDSNERRRQIRLAECGVQGYMRASAEQPFLMVFLRGRRKSVMRACKALEAHDRRYIYGMPQLNAHNRFKKV